MILSKTNRNYFVILIFSWLLVAGLLGTWMWWQLKAQPALPTSQARPLDEVSIKAALDQISVDNLTLATGSDTLKISTPSSSSAVRN